MAGENLSVKRVSLSIEELERLPRDTLVAKWREQEQYIIFLEDKCKNTDEPTGDEDAGRRSDTEEKLKQQEATRRENTLVHRLTTKEQELQDYMNQLQELKQAQASATAQLRAMLLDPAVNLVFQRMKKEMDDSKEKLEQTQNELGAWKFTPDSQTGKRLMVKCRMLLQENEELGKVLSSGRTAKLEGEIALEKALVHEMKKSQSELDEFLGEIDEDVEGMQSMIYMLQQQLREAKDQITQLQQQLPDQNTGAKEAELELDSRMRIKMEIAEKSLSQSNTRKNGSTPAENRRNEESQHGHSCMPEKPSPKVPNLSNESGSMLVQHIKQEKLDPAPSPYHIHSHGNTSAENRHSRESQHSHMSEKFPSKVSNPSSGAKGTDSGSVTKQPSKMDTSDASPNQSHTHSHGFTSGENKPSREAHPSHSHMPEKLSPKTFNLSAGSKVVETGLDGKPTIKLEGAEPTSNQSHTRSYGNAPAESKYCSRLIPENPLPKVQVIKTINRNFEPIETIICTENKPAGISKHYSADPEKRSESQDYKTSIEQRTACTNSSKTECGPQNKPNKESISGCTIKGHGNNKSSAEIPSPDVSISVASSVDEVSHTSAPASPDDPQQEHVHNVSQSESMPVQETRPCPDSVELDETESEISPEYKTNYRTAPPKGDRSASLSSPQPADSSEHIHQRIVLGNNQSTSDCKSPNADTENDVDDLSLSDKQPAGTMDVTDNSASGGAASVSASSNGTNVVNPGHATVRCDSTDISNESWSPESTQGSGGKRVTRGRKRTRANSGDSDNCDSAKVVDKGLTRNGEVSE